ncbi:hypothetical protein [Stenotrophomonas rhizophila]
MTTAHAQLNHWHRRQAALLYHFSSLPYLNGLLEKINQLISFTDDILEDRAGLDNAGRAFSSWETVNTGGHFSSHAYPALVDFRQDVIDSISSRGNERYSEAGERQCSRMLHEYAHQMIWATGEQENSFKVHTEEVFKYAGNISRMMRRPTTWNDFVFSLLWEQNKPFFGRIPRFRVRADIACKSGETPPRTGVYVPQDDPMAALQFGWTGGYGELGDTYTLNEFGARVLERVGRSGLWSDAQRLHELINEPQHRHLPNTDPSEREHVELAPAAVARQSFSPRPCKWYFVEMLDDEYEDHDGSYTGTSSVATSTRPHRVAGGELVPQSGWWYTPAKMGSTRYFKKDDRFPQLDGNEFGTTFWIWSPDQSAPKLG